MLTTVLDRKLGSGSVSGGTWTPLTHTAVIGGISETVYDYFNADIATAQDYYPFGMLMPGRASTSTGRFGFNGQQRDDEIAGIGNHLDFGARSYDPRLGRWWARDPLAIKYPFASPYNFALNTPIQAKDPDGRLVIFINGQHWALDDVGIKYWGEMGRKIMDRIGDNNAIYYDGALGGFKRSTLSTRGGFFSDDPQNLKAYDRYKAGYAQGMMDAKDIIDKLQRDKDGNIVESIKIVAHSMGGVYAKGFVAALQKYALMCGSHEEDMKWNPEAYRAQGPYMPTGTIRGFKIEFEVDIASFQPNSPLNSAIPGIRTVQISHQYDPVVNAYTPIAGSEERRESGVSLSDYHLSNAGKGHSIFSFYQELGYVPQSTSSTKLEKK